MQILQEQKSALPPTPANRVTEPTKIGKLFMTKFLGICLLVLSCSDMRYAQRTLQFTLDF
ncbi:MAG: hypothetical protein CVV06_17960 [Gammaproteobacteria bacterium HGW-Gammaproteobacteria-10]|nr:MAG: hypothetical protein CVV06_17960 [Gammaproteobacteria bacterium HGW-Gammaproteobacteria-10]